MHVLLGYTDAFVMGLGPLVGVVELDLVFRPDSVPAAPISAPAGMIDSSSSSLPELSGEEL